MAADENKGRDAVAVEKGDKSLPSQFWVVNTWEGCPKLRVTQVPGCAWDWLRPGRAGYHSTYEGRKAIVSEERKNEHF